VSLRRLALATFALLGLVLPAAAAAGVQVRGVDVATALDFGLTNSSDEVQLQAAADAGRVFVFL